MKQRAAACRTHGKGLVCCEKVEQGVRKPQIAYKRLSIEFSSVIVRRIWAFARFLDKHPIGPPARETTNFAARQVVTGSDPVRHSNYKLFANLKCGPASSMRIANGKSIDFVVLISLIEKPTFYWFRQQLGAFGVSMGRSIGLYEKEKYWVCLRRFNRLRYENLDKFELEITQLALD